VTSWGAVVAETPTPPALLAPAGTWFFNWVMPILGSLLILMAVADSVRRRRLTWGLLFLSNSMLVYWMETIGDWGQELIYSPTFQLHHLWDAFPLKTPNDPLFMPFAYAVYWTVHALAVLWLGQLVAKRFGWSMLKAILVLAIPVNYAWDFFVEGIAAAMGWWTYDPGIGPVLRFGNGGQITLLWTIGLMCFWPNLIAYWAGKPPVRGLNHFERFCGLQRFTRPKTPESEGAIGGQPMNPGPATTTAVALAAQHRSKQQQYDDMLNYEVTIPRWRFELARFGAWFAVFQVSFFAMLVLPLVAMRMVTGHDSVYGP
jgi:Spirocyclase AveC-like